MVLVTGVDIYSVSPRRCRLVPLFRKLYLQSAHIGFHWQVFSPSCCGMHSGNCVQKIMSEDSRTSAVVIFYGHFYWIKEHSRTLMRQSLECRWGFFKRNLTEKESSTLSVNSAVPWAGVLEWIKIEGDTKLSNDISVSLLFGWHHRPTCSYHCSF